jgi:microcystin-dependent protein
MARNLTLRGLLPWYSGGDKPAGHDQQKDLAETLADRVVFFDRGLLVDRPAATPDLQGSIYDALDGALSWCTGTEWVPVSGAGHIPIGGTLDWQWSSEPPGPAVWLEYVGQWVTKTTYPELFAAVGVSDSGMYLPDRRGRSPMGAGKAPSLTNRVVGQALGEERHSISKAELPSYWLTVMDPGHFHLFDRPALVQAQAGNDTGYAQHSGLDSNTRAATTGISVHSGGSGNAANVVHPSTVTRYFVRAR